MIEIKNITKTYGSKKAVNNLSLNVKQGEILCFFGPNGSGKTTTINILLDFIKPDSGSASICGFDVNKQANDARKNLAYIPELVMLYKNLTGIENLEYFSRLSGFKYSRDELISFLEEAGLSKEHADKNTDYYSKGMRQKVGIATAIAKKAKVLLLDEPTSGLDPQASYEFSELLIKMSKNNVSVFMATHDIFRTKELNATVAIMKYGDLKTVFSSDDFSHTDIEKMYLEYIS
jgi:ABC-2 type transport system ATP-binding protein